MRTFDQNIVDQLDAEMSADQESTAPTDQIKNENTFDGVKLKIFASRKRTVTYWGNGNQYEKEEISLLSGVEKVVTLDKYQEESLALWSWLQDGLKKEIDKQEKILNKKEVPIEVIAS